MLFNSLKIATVVTCLSFSLSVFGEEENVDTLTGMQVSPEEIHKSLAKMKADGQISAEDFEKAKRHVASMSSTDLKVLNETAIGMVKNDPDKAVELSKGKLDVGAVQKQIKSLSSPADH